MASSEGVALPSTTGAPASRARTTARVARGVPEPVLLLEREVMFLVDDEQSRPRERHEHRGASAHQHVRGAVARMRPRREPLAVGEPGVKRRDAAVEPRVKAGEELRGETDLRNEHERLAAAGDDLLDEPQVHLRLAAAGDAIEHEGGEFPEARLDRLHGAALLGVEDGAMGVGGRIQRIRNGRRGAGGRPGQPDAAGRRSPLDADRLGRPGVAGAERSAGCDRAGWSTGCGESARSTARDESG